MAGSNKILTVSYGTFSCTLEGFEDSFETMKAIAEYFRDLAADDRYFGAEPAKPDAEMMARIAEREISRRVEARSDMRGITLRAGTEAADAAPGPARAPAGNGGQRPPMPAGADRRAASLLDDFEAEEEDDAFLPAAPPAPRTAPPEPQEVESVAAKLQRIRAAVGRAAPAAPLAAGFAPPPFAATDAGSGEAATAEASGHATGEAPRAADSAAPAGDDPDAAAPDAATADSGHAGAQAMAEEDAGLMARVHAAQAEEAEEARAPAETTPAEATLAATPDDALTEAQATDADDDAALAEPVMTAEPEDAGRDDGLAEAATDADELYEDEIAETEIATIDALPGSAASFGTGPWHGAGDADPHEAATEDEAESDAGQAPAAETDADLLPTAEAEAAVGMQAENGDFAGTDGEPALATEADGAAAADLEPTMAADAEEIAATQGEPSFSAEAEDTAEPRDDAAEAADRRDSFVAEAEAAPETDADETADTSDDAAEAAEAVETGEPMHVAAEAAETDDTAESWQPGAGDAAPEDAASTKADPALAAEAGDAAEPAEAAGSSAHAARSGRAILHGQPEADEAAMSRILSETDAHLMEPEGNRRRQAIAQLKAAVAATEAARRLGERPEEDAHVETAFRNDLRQVVRPRRPQLSPAEPRSERPSGIPLKLVASQRVDESLRESITDPGPETMPATPVRPRRIAAAMVDAVAGDSDSFASFAARMKAKDLPDLLEAAAAHAAFVEGAEDFSRPQIMKKVRQMLADDFSREDGLRTFGTLLRQGRITKVRNGRFQVSAQTRFNPERRAG